MHKSAAPSIRASMMIERDDDNLTPATLGLSLKEGRELLRRIQEAAVSAQTASWLASRSRCPVCGIELSRKDRGTIVCRTIFGKVRVASPRFRQCWCRTPSWCLGSFTFSPLAAALRQRVTSELEQLQVEWAAQLPYRVAVRLLTQILPLTDAISVSGTRNRVLAVGQDLHEQSERQIEELPRARRPGVASASVSVVAVDSVWLKHCENGRLQGRQLNVVAGRATLAEGGTRLYGYVTRQVASGAKRLDLFLSQQGVRPTERVTAITDGAFEFDTAAAGSALTGARILDWFHVAMKFRAAQMSAVMLSLRSPAQWGVIERSLERAKWLVWHGKAHTALGRLRSILDAIDAIPKQNASTLIWNVGRLLGYLESNERYLVQYAARHRAGLPISSATAESAVNQLVSRRMAKRQQMRWSEQGAHLLVQVRAAFLNGTLKPRARPVPWTGSVGYDSDQCFAHLKWELEPA
jgi:hypothetical protein